jgi:hypothetical protein
MDTYPCRVQLGSLTGTALRLASPADDDQYIDLHFFDARSGQRLQPRSVVRWDIGKGLTTSTADRALEVLAERG